MTPTALPPSCDILVVGAGPAGSACAQWLARHGIDVLLVDQHVFPRDKICGDGLIPDAHACLRRLGVLDEVMALAQGAGHVRCIGPRGGQVDVPGALAVLPRKLLDHILCRAAQDAGAVMAAPYKFEAPLLDQDQVVGARFRQGELTHEVRARAVVLATGAVPQALIASQSCKRRVPTGIALRGYVRNDAMTGRITELEVVWHQKLRPGYGWIFPCGNGVFNIGAGVLQNHAEASAEGSRGKGEVNLRDVFNAFTECHAPARELMAGGTLVGELKGAPLRCGLEGAQWSRPGLLVTGEAAGSTYAFSGEGIGKAMETGLLAAEALIAARDEALSDEAMRQRYEAGLALLKPRFDLYERANKVNTHPWLADLVIWRARRSPRLLARMAGVLNETSNPGNLLSIKGFMRLFTE